MVAGFWIMVCGLWFLAFGFWFLDYDLWFLVSGLWFLFFLVAACWVAGFLVSGFWLLVSSFWFLLILNPPSPTQKCLHMRRCEPKPRRTLHSCVHKLELTCTGLFLLVFVLELGGGSVLCFLVWCVACGLWFRFVVCSTHPIDKS